MTTYPGLFPDGGIVLVYGVAPGGSCEMLVAMADGRGDPIITEPAKVPDGAMVLVKPL
jgi:hypothetical protein